jgi:hypothetical protein
MPAAKLESSHPVRCRCGSVRGSLARTDVLNRCSCYCRSCHAFAHYLGRPDEILDAHGGTDIVQVRSRGLRFERGSESIACLGFTPGTLRWYARCCRTALANTPRSRTLPIAGVIHDCLHGEGAPPLDTAFGRVAMNVYAEEALSPPPARRLPQLLMIARLAPTALRARFDASYRRSPFRRGDGAPIAEQRLLREAERNALLARPPR